MKNKPINDGGPAFPVPMIPSNNDGGFTEIRYGGMTLRDYFAGQALSALVGKAAFDQKAEDMMMKSGVKSEEFDEFVAMLAYDFADTMIAQREKPPARE